MRKFNYFSLVLAAILFLQLVFTGDAVFAASKSKNTDDEEIKKIEKKVDLLIKKIYASSLFSPDDAEKLVDVKNKLDSNTKDIKDPAYARLLFDVGYICKEREYTDEAIRYFKLVHEKFPETAYATRSVNELNKMGIDLFSEEEKAEEEEY